MPADAPPEAQIIVETESPVGQDRVEQSVTTLRDYRLLLTSDKPLYQPGQTIHMRALALSTFDLTPARGAIVDFLVEDPKGNKVFRQSVTASDFGVAATDFTLADMVNQGDYKLSVSIGADTGGLQTRLHTEKTVEVRPYVLPKFGVEVSTDRSFYLPGERLEGVVQADYFFGKPVALGEVQVVGSVWEIERTVVVDLRGQTDENGTYEFSFDLPEYFAGAGLDVTAEDPVPEGAPLLDLPNVILTGHSAWYSETADSESHFWHRAMDQVVTALKGVWPAYAVNPEVCKAWMGKWGDQRSA